MCPDSFHVHCHVGKLLIQTITYFSVTLEGKQLFGAATANAIWVMWVLFRNICFLLTPLNLMKYMNATREGTTTSSHGIYNNIAKSLKVIWRRSIVCKPAFWVLDIVIIQKTVLQPFNVIQTASHKKQPDGRLVSYSTSLAQRLPEIFKQRVPCKECTILRLYTGMLVIIIKGCRKRRQGISSRKSAREVRNWKWIHLNLHLLRKKFRGEICFINRGKHFFRCQILFEKCNASHDIRRPMTEAKADETGRKMRSRKNERPACGVGTWKTWVTDKTRRATYMDRTRCDSLTNSFSSLN